MKVNQTINEAIHANPEIRLILEIAARARAVEENSAPTELRASTDVVAIPIKPQCVV
jgi:hypothetical protein